VNYFTGCSRVNSTLLPCLLPEGKTAPPPLLTNIIATDRMEIVQGTAGNVDGDWKSLGRAWVLNPPGCFRLLVAVLSALVSLMARIAK
jgi:hypothetical protein